MKLVIRIIVLSLAAVMVTSAWAQNGNVQQEARAVAVLKSMSDHIDALPEYHIKGQSSNDARLFDGLLISNTAEIEYFFKLPGSLFYERFDGTGRKKFYIHNGKLTLFDDSTNLFGQADVSEDLQTALEFTLDNLLIDLPLMDLILKDSFNNLLAPTDSAFYVSDKARVLGVDCHQIAIRTPQLDIQIWVQEGAQPLPRRIVITSKWLGGAPRFVANLEWDVNPGLDEERFEFSPPESASRIEFITALDQED